MGRWARFVFRRRKLVLLSSLVLWLVCGGIVLHGTTLSSQNTFTFESGRAATLVANQLGSKAGGVELGVIYTDNAESATSPAFMQQVATALAPVRRDRRIASVLVPWAQPAAAESVDISANHHSAIVTITLKTSDFNVATGEADAIYSESHSSRLQETSFGELAVEAAINHYVSSDLVAGSAVSLPAALLLLLLIFGTAAAALTCIGVGVVSVTIGLAAMFVLNSFSPVSPYASDVVGLIGLGVGVDYSLFITSRFREELARGASTETALVIAYTTAGRAIAFSGFIVAVGLSGMLFFQGTFLVSMGLAGAMVVIATLLSAMTLLCSLLAILGNRVNRFRVPYFGRQREHGEGMWHRIAEFVMAHPIWVLVPALAILLLAGSPFPSIQLVNSDYTTLPQASPARQGSELLASAFPQQNETTVDVVIQFNKGGPFTESNIATAFDLSHRFIGAHNVLSVESYVNLSPSLTLADYQHLYAGGVGKSTLPAATLAQVTTSTGSSIALVELQSHLNEQSNAAMTLVNQIRAHDHIHGATVLVGGDTAFNVDFVAFMEAHTPLAAIYVMIITFLALLLLLRSVVLPLKAVIMNLLSMSAAFGAMVWIFQEGHLGGLLNVTPSPIDATLPPLLFCIVFGLSMDYEVFLLTRMQEQWEATHDNRRAVANGLEASGRLVTGAAAIMIAVFAAFAFGHVVVIKAIGMGMAVAVTTDATLVRALVVPALMRLLGRVNWWAPRWLRRRSSSGAAAAKELVA